jgi:hypothetical protein
MAHHNIGCVHGRWMVPLLLAGCPPFDEDGPYRCSENSDCRSDERCAEGVCAPACIPKTCADVPDRCGSILDECGGTIECECTAPETCGGGDVAGQCGCAPRECTGDKCGAFDDGCGGTVDCTCEAPMTCGGGGLDGVCGCTAKSCDEQSLECGLASDGCDATIFCGGCDRPELCGAEQDHACGRPSRCTTENAACGFLGADYCGTCSGGTTCGVPAANECGRPATCLAEGRACGFSGAMPGLFCGGCGVGEMCEAGACVPSVRPFCWGPREQVMGGGTGLGGSVVAESGQLIAYAEFPTSGGGGCSRASRAVFTDYATISTASYQLLDSSDFSDLSLSGCTDNPNESCEGWIGRPRVRPDALEMFLDSSYRCADWYDREIYLSFRRNPTDPWSLPFMIPVSLYTAMPDDSVDYPVLLPDHHTLVYHDSALPPGQLAIARRPSSDPGDGAFVKMGSLSLDDLPPPEITLHVIVPQGVSCDGKYLHYYREQTDADRMRVDDARSVEILSLDPLTFGPPAAYEGVTGILGFVESPDCGALYSSNGSTQFVKRRIACP